jgi:ElaB/YqjD/DUF883 family membrane-anchored ribosome-binding protein
MVVKFGVHGPLVNPSKKFMVLPMDETKVSERVSQAAEGWTEKAKGTAQEVSDTAQEWAQKAQGTARDVGAAADLYVREYAWTTVVLVAITAGFIGYLLGRREA